MAHDNDVSVGAKRSIDNATLTPPPPPLRPPPPPPPPPDELAPAPKRVKFEEGTGGASSVVAATVSPEAVKQLKAALRKIRLHIGTASKASKAIELMRKLLDDGSLVPEVALEAFQVLCEAMADPSRTDDVELRRSFRKLIISAEANEKLWSKAQKRHLEVWKIWAILRPQLHTDDSFVFTKVANNVGSLVAELPELGPEEDDAFRGIQSGAWDTERRARCQEMDDRDASATPAEQAGTSGASSAAAATAADREADPFGLDAFLEAEDKKKAEVPAQASAKGLVWSATECRVMRRQALLDCLSTMMGLCKHAWARSSAFQAIEGAWHRRDYFCAGQQPQVQSLHDFVQKSRSTVRKGPSASLLKQDANAFERAQKEWSTKSVSGRGKVGAAGDAKATGWLG